MNHTENSFDDLTRECLKSSIALLRLSLDRMPGDSQEAVALALARGARIGLETTMDRAANWGARIVLIEPEGTRHVLGDIDAIRPALDAAH